MKSIKRREGGARRRRPSASAQRCEYCGERLVRGVVSVYRHRGGRHILFQNMPALICQSCGQREFEADAVESMEQRLTQTAGRGRKAELLVVSA